MLRQISKEMAEILFEEHAKYVFRVAMFLTNSKELADDITQETFLKVYSKYNSFDHTKPIRPWIYKITLNITRNILRKQKWLSFTHEIPDEACKELIETDFVASEEAEALWHEVCKLSQKGKEVIVLHFYLGMKLREVAIVLGIPEGTCKSRLNAALNVLRKSIGKQANKVVSLGGVYYESK